ASVPTASPEDTATPTSDGAETAAASSSATGTAADTATLEVTASAEAAPDATPDAARAMEHIRHLSEGIGPRAAGSEEEREAADYIAEQLQSAGYETELEEFTFE